MTDQTDSGLFTIYQDSYLAIRAQYEFPGEPVLYNGWIYCETLPPKGWSEARYRAYFGEVTRLAGWYRETLKYAARRRKTAADRARYTEACERFGVAGHDLRFAGEPAQEVLFP
jgi:hypothetical protein